MNKVTLKLFLKCKVDVTNFVTYLNFTPIYDGM